MECRTLCLSVLSSSSRYCSKYLSKPYFQIQSPSRLSPKSHQSSALCLQALLCQLFQYICQHPLDTYFLLQFMLYLHSHSCYESTLSCSSAETVSLLLGVNVVIIIIPSLMTSFNLSTNNLSKSSSSNHMSMYPYLTTQRNT